MEGLDSGRTGQVLQDLVQAERDNMQYLSQLDGAIGGGDHGVNLNKGFGLWAEQLRDDAVRGRQRAKRLQRS